MLSANLHMINNFTYFSDYFVILKHLKYSIARKMDYREISLICHEKMHTVNKNLIFLKNAAALNFNLFEETILN